MSDQAGVGGLTVWIQLSTPMGLNGFLVSSPSGTDGAAPQPGVEPPDLGQDEAPD